MTEIEFEEINLDWIDEPKFIHDSVEINYSKIKNGGLGIIAKKFIKKGTFLGNYMGSIHDELFMDNDYCQYGVKRNNKSIFFNATDIEKSNYIRYINCSYNFQSENVIKISFGIVPFLVNGKLYSNSTSENNSYTFYKSSGKEINIDGYVMCFASRDINEGEELYHWYGVSFKDDFVKEYESIRAQINDINKSVAIIGTSEQLNEYNSKKNQ